MISDRNELLRTSAKRGNPWNMLCADLVTLPWSQLMPSSYVWSANSFSDPKRYNKSSVFHPQTPWPHFLRRLSHLHLHVRSELLEVVAILQNLARPTVSELWYHVGCQCMWATGYWMTVYCLMMMDGHVPKMAWHNDDGRTRAKNGVTQGKSRFRFKYDMQTKWTLVFHNLLYSVTVGCFQLSNGLLNPAMNWSTLCGQNHKKSTYWLCSQSHEPVQFSLSCLPHLRCWAQNYFQVSAGPGTHSKCRAGRGVCCSSIATWERASWGPERSGSIGGECICLFS